MQCARPGAFLEAEEAFRRALAGDELAVALVDIRGDEPGALGIGAREDQRRHAADIGRETRGDEIALMRGGRDQHLAAHVAALLLGRQLVLEVHAGRARLDIGLHDLERVERPAEAGLGIGDDRHEPVALRAAFGVLDLVGALQRAVDAAAQLRAGIGRIEALVGIHRARRVGVGGDLPAGEIDGLEARARHLHRLVAGDGAERMDIGHGLELRPQTVGAHLRQRVGDLHRAAQAHDLGGAIRALDAVETAGRRGNESVEALGFGGQHGHLL